MKKTIYSFILVTLFLGCSGDSHDSPEDLAPLVLFTLGHKTTGNILSLNAILNEPIVDAEVTARKVIDAACKQEGAAVYAAMNLSSEDVDFKGFVSLAEDDEIRDFTVPLDRQVVGPQQKEISVDFSNLIAGTLTHSFLDAGIDVTKQPAVAPLDIQNVPEPNLPEYQTGSIVVSNEYFTHSAADGSLDSESCTGGTVSTSSWGVGSTTESPEHPLNDSGIRCYLVKAYLCVGIPSE